jgi:hypothetical protein
MTAEERGVLQKGTTAFYVVRGPFKIPIARTHASRSQNLYQTKENTSSFYVPRFFGLPYSEQNLRSNML